MPPNRLLPCFLLMLFLPAQAVAWGEPGHRVVAELASRQLRPAASAEVARLLAGEPEPTLAGVASWADQLRESGSPLGESTKRWHYVDFKGGDCNYVPPRDCPDGNCVVGAINRNFLALADFKRSDAERRDALKFLVHLVADVHQPLHASPRDDQGGNQYQVALNGNGSNLHRIWDAEILKQLALSPPGEVARLSRQPSLPPDPTRRSDRPAVDWALESCRIVGEGRMYPAKHVIDKAYLQTNLPVVETRLRRAGSRLADMINYALDPPRAVARP